MHQPEKNFVVDLTTGLSEFSASAKEVAKKFIIQGECRGNISLKRRTQRTRIFCAKYSADSRFVVTGSDDTNIRLWKAVASDRLGTV